jgi:Transglycosylase
VVLAIVVLLLPIVYFVVAMQLPDLDSEFDLERALKTAIESERMSAQIGLSDRTRDIEWARPDFGRLPKNLVAFYITERGCPTFFQSPREDGLQWAKRLMGTLVNVEPEGDGYCELVFSWNLAGRAGAKTDLQRTVASQKIHRYLRKDSMVAYDLNSLYLDKGVVGVEDGARALFSKALPDLNLAELAEFALALPPHGYWRQIRNCQNSTLIRQNRDTLLQRLQLVGLIPEDAARTAMSQQVACLRAP